MTYALIYHDVADAADRERCGFPGASAARYKLDWAQFEAHLDAIAATGREVGLAHSGADVALTFDDGGSSAVAVAEALERRGWRGHFFITTERIGTPGFIDADGARELAARGHDVGSHSHTHPSRITALDREALGAEWRTSRARLAEILGRPPETAGVPGGYLSRAVVDEAARAGYRLLMTSQPTARRRRRDGLEVHGRFIIRASTSPERAAAFASGNRGVTLAAWLDWQAKQLPRRLSPEAYERLRRLWARRRSG